ncbi:putative nuclease HARBI1 isoform X2, partial [Tanacetum coccineum]
SYEAPLPKGNTLGSAEDSVQLKELMVLVPKLVNRIGSLEKELKKTKQTLGNAVLTLVKKVKTLQVDLKRKSKKLADFVTPTKASGEAQEEEISPTILEAAKTIIDTRLDAEEEINIGREEINTSIEEVSTGSTKVDSSTASERGQREGKAPIIEEDIQATDKTKERLRQEEAGLEEDIKLQAQLDEESAQEDLKHDNEESVDGYESSPLIQKSDSASNLKIFQLAEQRLIDDYFDDDEYEPKYPEEKFRRRYFRVRIDAIGRNSIGPILKCTSAIRQMAYGTAPDAFDEYLQIAELQTWTPGMLGSIDCMHWDWKNCPKALHGQFKRSTHKYPTLMLEAVADQKLWIWHAYFGVPGANNDLNVLYGSPLFDDEIAILIDCRLLDEKSLKFKRVQEAARKDIERAFGVLQGRWGIIRQPARAMQINTLKRIITEHVRDGSKDVTYTLGQTKDFALGKRTTIFEKDLVEIYGNNDDEQVTLSRSSAEAEYRGVANAVAETCWLRNILRELHTPLSTATLVYCDNYAYVFTKGLPTVLFDEFRSSLSVRSSPAQTAGGC